MTPKGKFLTLAPYSLAPLPLRIVWATQADTRLQYPLPTAQHGASSEQGLSTVGWKDAGRVEKASA